MMKTRKAVQASAALFLAAGLLLSGCTDKTGQTASTASPSGKAAASLAPAVKKGGTLKIGMVGAITDLGYIPTFRSINEIFAAGAALETLTRYNEKGEIVPWLAESFKADSAAKTVTYVLRKGVKFHDGTDLNASAVKWNVDLALEAKQVELADVQSVDAVDERTVRINLKNWNSSILDALTNYNWIVSPEAYKKNGKDGAMKNPVGTGPYQFVSLEKDVAVKFKKFDGYWQAGKPNLDAVEFDLFSDPTVALNAFKSKEINIYFSATQQYAKEMESTANVISLKSGIGAGEDGLIANSASPKSPFADVRVRKAMGYAIDVKQMMDTFMYGYAIPTTQWGASGFWSYNPEVKGTPYDPEKAKQLLKETGYPNGFATTLYATPDVQQRMAAVQGYLSKVGINAKIELIDSAKMSKMSSDGSWDGIMGFPLRGGEPELGLYMPRYFSASSVRFGKGMNISQELPQLFKDLQSATDEAVKKKTAMQIQKLVWEDQALAFPLWLNPIPSILQKNVADSGINKTSGSFWTPEDIRLNP